MERAYKLDDKPIIRDGKYYFVFVCDFCYGSGLSEESLCETCPQCHGYTTITRRPTPSGGWMVFSVDGIKSSRLDKIASS